MPRRTAKSRKTKNNGNTTGNLSTTTTNTKTTTKTITKTTDLSTSALPITNNAECEAPTVRRRGRTIKKKKPEKDTAAEIVTEQVYHRKSERRRVARDIFLVFEEQPSSRRSGRTNKKQPTKPKFGHLKVEDPVSKSKGLLRDIKNEPKCYLTNSSNIISTNVRTVAPAAAKNNNTKPQQQSREICVQQRENKLNFQKLNTKSQCKNPTLTAQTIAREKTVDNAVKDDSASKQTPVARVNPIFLWVKQDDTRIVEVRCEDYDKRNRIRITKTSNGWRAIPRSDPTSSRVLKFYPTPLMKVKRENHVQQQQQQKQLEANNNSRGSCLIENKHSLVTANKNKDFMSKNALKEVDVVINNVGFKLTGIDTVVCNPLATATKTKKKKKSKKRKKKKNSAVCRKNSKKSYVTATKELLMIENLSNANQSPLPLLADYCTNENKRRDIQETPKEEKDQQHPEKTVVECKIDKDSNETPENILVTPVDDDDNFLDNHSVENALEKTIKPVLTTPTFLPVMSLSSNRVPGTPSAAATTATELESTYQKASHEEELSFQLCPKTGLFLPNNRIYEGEVSDDSNNNKNNNEIMETEDVMNSSGSAAAAAADAAACLNQNKEQLMIIDLDKINAENKNQSLDDNTAESLEAKTKNLKDLLDDADLLQHCDDNANSDADLIDTLVKTSCENNLIQANEIIAKGGSMDHHLQHHHLHHHSNNQKSLQHTTNELVVQLITDVSDPPKCLSFNEAGEIEGFNGELFQATNSYMETFEKLPSSGILSESQLPQSNSPLMSVVTSASSAPQQKQPTICGEIVPAIMDMTEVNSSNKKNKNIIDDSPKDLSYKKREEVCPPSESRSQCAVTSSSDIVKSPQQNDTSALTTSSETLKNLILEQFMKLNAMSNHHQPKDAVDVAQQIQPDVVTHSNSSIYTKSGTSSSFIETVVIDDDDDNDGGVNSEAFGEPLKKRIRLNTTHSLTSSSVESGNVKSKMAMMDKDPDPLTQLRLLIRNTQWKVPDPILVPKDRLSAVLASPAREIPLLITTRPELRLPEAFAYPEIIQNPNILVISMAQLEAILQNEVEMGKSTPTSILGPKVGIHSPEQQTVVQLTKQLNNFHAAQSLHHLPQLPPKPTSNTLNNSCQLQNKDITLDVENSSTPGKDGGGATKCTHIDSSLATDINAATMAVLNQMLWLPYFGQISQDLMKSLKTPLGMQHKCSANLMPFYSTQLTTGLQNLEEVYKSNNVINQMQHNDSPDTIGMSNLQQQDASNELSLFQKIVQHQMQNVLQLNQHLKSTDASQRKVATPTTAGSATTTTTVNPLQSTSIEISGAASVEPTKSLIGEHKKQKNCVLNEQKSTNPLAASKTPAETGSNNSLNVSEKSYNLRSSAAGRQASSETKQYSSSNNQTQSTDNKPRLTCKSLSNLLDPEHSHQHSLGSSSSSSAANTSITYSKNLTSDFLKGINGMNAHTIDCKNTGRGEARTAAVAVTVGAPPPSEVAMVHPSISRSVCSLTNPSIEGNIDFSKQHKARSSFADNLVSENTLANHDPSSLSTETNAPLWHPLFGSNSKSAYSSPWQWTTVTATGE